MKKVLALIMALVLVLSLVACGGGSRSYSSGGTTTNETEAPTESPAYKIGDTVNGELYDFTLNSVTFIDKIKDGRANIVVYNNYGNKRVEEYDAVAEDGYTIAKIELTIGYHGKKENTLLLSGITLDYDDGYTFYPKAWNDSMHTKQDVDSGYYTFNDEELTVSISDPLTFKSEKRTIYIFVNDEVKTQTTKPLYLKYILPTEDSDEEVAFNLR